jgi:hypothetical protein
MLNGTYTADSPTPLSAMGFSPNRFLGTEY